MNDLGAGVMITFMIIFMLFGGVWFGEYLTSTTIPNSQWECTKSIIIDGKSECATYERKSK